MEDEREWVVFIQGELEKARTGEEAPYPSIFMASSPLRCLKLEAFLPQVVAIGPYHSDLGPHHSSFPDNQETQRYKDIAAKEMEKHKIVASTHVARTLPRADFCTLVEEFLKDISKVRDQYDLDLACRLDEKLAYMLALDCSFVVEVMRCAAAAQDNTRRGQLQTGFNAYYCSRFPRPLRKSILQDFVLLENQVPLFLLLKVIRIDRSCATDEQALQDLGSLVAKFACEVLPFNYQAEDRFASEVYSEAYDLERRKHLLDCLYGIVTHAGDHAGKVQLVEKPSHFPSAVDLYNSGITFKPVELGNMRSIKYDARRAILHVPKVRVSDDTEKLLRNLTAYESHLIDQVHVLSYLRFMNSLVDTAEDVALLVDMGIVAQDIGSNDEVACMWNNLCMNTMRVCTKEYEDIAVRLVEHCQHKTNALKAEFTRTYLSRPWLVVSLLSGAALLIMTFLIMYYTVKLYLKPGG